MLSTSWSPWIISLARTQTLRDGASDHRATVPAEEFIFGRDKRVWHNRMKMPQITGATPQQCSSFTGTVSSPQPGCAGRSAELATFGDCKVDKKIKDFPQEIQKIHAGNCGFCAEPWNYIFLSWWREICQQTEVVFLLQCSFSQWNNNAWLCNNVQLLHPIGIYCIASLWVASLIHLLLICSIVWLVWLIHL